MADETPVPAVSVKPALAACVLATVILYFTAFAPGYFHNAAHDARHAFATPCH